MKINILLLILFLVDSIWAMDSATAVAVESLQQRDRNYGVARLKELAALRVSKNLIAAPLTERTLVLSKLTWELKELVSHNVKWLQLKKSLFPIEALQARLTTFNADRSQVACVIKNDANNDVIQASYRNRPTEVDHIHLQPQGAVVKTIAWHPSKDKSLIAFATSDAIIFMNLINKSILNLLITPAITGLIHAVRWCPNGRYCMIATDKEVHFVHHETWQFCYSTTNVPFKSKVFNFGDGTVNEDAMWSPSGAYALFRHRKPFVNSIHVKKIFQKNKKNVSGLPLGLPLSALECETKDEEKLLLSTGPHIVSMKIKYKKCSLDSSTAAYEYYSDNTHETIDQILSITTRYLLLKICNQSENIRRLAIFDRDLKKCFMLCDARCEGKIKLTDDKKFVYGSALGDSFIDISYLTTSHSLDQLLGHQEL